MVEDKLITIRDAALILGISEQAVIDLAESRELPAYKVGGVYLRFKREQLEEFKKTHKGLSADTQIISQDPSFKEKVSDFLYFYDFYILAILIIILMLVIIFRG